MEFMSANYKLLDKTFNIIFNYRYISKPIAENLHSVVKSQKPVSLWRRIRVTGSPETDNPVL